MRAFQLVILVTAWLVLSVGCIPSPRISSSSPSSLTTVISNADIAAKVIPSVAYIYSEVEQTGSQDFVASAGSGVILRADGYILTNKHVVQKARLVEVTLENGETYPATKQWEDDVVDLAVVKIDATGLTALPFANPDTIRVGDQALAFGHALGVTPLKGGLTVTSGIVSNLGRSFFLTGSEHYDIIQTDAAINPGNSGGPLVNTSGEMIGVNSAGVTDAQGIGFAINVGIARHVFEDLVKYGKSYHPFLGIVADDVTQDVARRLKCACDDGSIVSEVEAYGPAAAAGMEVDDMITSIDGNRVNTAAELVKWLWRHEVGDRVEIVFHRGADEKKVIVTLGERTGGQAI